MFAKSFLLLVSIVTHNILSKSLEVPTLHGERRIVIITASYNNRDWYQKNLDSIFMQEYENYFVVYTDDCSSDGTSDLVEAYIREHDYADKCHVVKNKQRKGALANIYNAIHTYCQDTDIVALVDGDDWLPHTQVLAKVNDTYADSNVWLTYGQMYEYPSGRHNYCRLLPEHVVDRGVYRESTWCTSHLRTFYAWLFKQIKHEDFLDGQGNFWPMAWDMSIMFPLLEMVGQRYKFIPDIMYVYNMQNSLNDNKVDSQLQRDCECALRHKTKYKRLHAPIVNKSFQLQNHEQWWVKNAEKRMGELKDWLGNEDADSRVKMRSYLKEKGYKNILDIPCGLCTEFFGYRKDGIDIDYYGADITPQLVERARKLGLNIVQASIEDLPFADSTFDICYARHILEHLSYYEKGVDEIIRVADKEALVIFFIKPQDTEVIYAPVDVNAVIYHNQYDKHKLEEYVVRNPKVSSIAWEDINNDEVVLHIYLK